MFISLLLEIYVEEKKNIPEKEKPSLCSLNMQKRINSTGTSAGCSKTLVLYVRQNHKCPTQASGKGGKLCFVMNQRKVIFFQHRNAFFFSFLKKKPKHF